MRPVDRWCGACGYDGHGHVDHWGVVYWPADEFWRVACLVCLAFDWRAPGPLSGVAVDTAEPYRADPWRVALYPVPADPPWRPAVPLRGAPALTLAELLRLRSLGGLGDPP
jgi:hypothetical protein